MLHLKYWFSFEKRQAENLNCDGQFYRFVFVFLFFQLHFLWKKVWFIPFLLICLCPFSDEFYSELKRTHTSQKTKIKAKNEIVVCVVVGHLTVFIYCDCGKNKLVNYLKVPCKFSYTNFVSAFLVLNNVVIELFCFSLSTNQIESRQKKQNWNFHGRTLWIFRSSKNQFAAFSLCGKCQLQYVLFAWDLKKMCHKFTKTFRWS